MQSKRIEQMLADAVFQRIKQRPELEQTFHPNRRWRFDLFYPKQKLAIEVDGGFHASIGANRRDAHKRNAAMEAGIRVLTYPASAVTTKKRLPRIVTQICRVLCGVNDFDQSGTVLDGD